MWDQVQTPMKAIITSLPKGTKKGTALLEPVRVEETQQDHGYCQSHGGTGMEDGAWEWGQRKVVMEKIKNLASLFSYLSHLLHVIPNPTGSQNMKSQMHCVGDTSCSAEQRKTMNGEEEMGCSAYNLLT